MSTIKIKNNKHITRAIFVGFKKNKSALATGAFIGIEVLQQLNILPPLNNLPINNVLKINPLILLKIIINL